MVRRPTHRIALLAALAAFATAAPSALASGSQVLADCSATGHLSRSYSASDLHAALATMPADVKEYTDCYDVVERALLAKLSSGQKTTDSGSSQGSSGGSFLPPAVIVVLALLAIAAASLATVALRRRSRSGAGET